MTDNLVVLMKQKYMDNTAINRVKQTPFKDVKFKAVSLETVETNEEWVEKKEQINYHGIMMQRVWEMEEKVLRTLHTMKVEVNEFQTEVNERKQKLVKFQQKQKKSIRQRRILIDQLKMKAFDKISEIKQVISYETQKDAYFLQILENTCAQNIDSIAYSLATSTPLPKLPESMPDSKQTLVTLKKNIQKLTNLQNSIEFFKAKSKNIIKKLQQQNKIKYERLTEFIKSISDELISEIKNEELHRQQVKESILQFFENILKNISL